jgi:hypothetical protein
MPSPLAEPLIEEDVPSGPTTMTKTTPVQADNTQEVEIEEDLEEEDAPEQQQQQREHHEQEEVAYHPPPPDDETFDLDTAEYLHFSDDNGAVQDETSPPAIPPESAAAAAATVPTAAAVVPNPPVTTQTTRVNGLGLWMSWTRNFKNPQAAFLDLMDNAVDAADVTTDGGKIEVLMDDPGQGLGCKPGLILVNNSHKPIKDVGQILEVYHSTKHKAADSVGENGVGLKQGCAALANLSFIVVRNGDDLHVGLLAKQLQHDEGVCLPSYLLGHVSSGITPDVMVANLCAQHVEFATCITTYGGGSVELGSERLATNIHHIVHNGTWNRDHHIFMLILNQLVHSTTGYKPPPKGLPYMEPEPKVNLVPTEQSPQTDTEYVHQFLNDLRGLLPKQYIHIPSSFHLLVNHQNVQFEYWQRRLVETTSFKLKIDKNHLFSQDPYWNQFRHREPGTFYELNVYIGFDPSRVVSKHVAAEIRVYSRYSGRMITHLEDARTMLGLTAGGTDFCQGLTIIVDDYNGNLPLNPTKQDLAFAEEENGKNHEINLFNWIGAVAWTFWRKYWTICGKSKEILTERIKEASKANAPVAPLPSVRKCDFNRFVSPKNQTWCISGSSNKRIRSKYNDFTIRNGDHTPYRIRRGDLPPPEVLNPKASASSQSRKRKNSLGGTESDPIDLNMDVRQRAASVRSGTIVVPGQPQQFVPAATQVAARAAAAQVAAQAAQMTTARETKWKHRAQERANHIRQLEAEVNRIKQNNSILEQKLRRAPQSPQDGSRIHQLEETIRQLRKEKIEYTEARQVWETERMKLHSDLRASHEALQRALLSQTPGQDNGEGTSPLLERKLKREKERNAALKEENDGLRQQIDSLQKQISLSQEDDQW